MSDSFDHPEFMRVDTRYRQYASAPGGIPAAVAIPRANKAVAELKGRFVWEFGADMTMLEGLLGMVKEQGQANGPTVGKAYHRCRRIRDLAGTFGYRIVTDVADRLCELLYRIQAADTLSVEAVDLCYAGLVKVSSPDGEAMSDDDKRALLAHLDEAIDRLPRVFNPEEVKSL